MKNFNELAKGWFRKGDSDLHSARTMLGTSGPYDTSCFHAQQAIEKYMKGFLDYNCQTYPPIHDLGKLAVLCAAVDSSLHFSTSELAALTDYAVVLRYDCEFWPTRQIADDALKFAEHVREVILAKIPENAQP